MESTNRFRRRSSVEAEAIVAGIISLFPVGHDRPRNNVSRPNNMSRPGGCTSQQTGHLHPTPCSTTSGKQSPHLCHSYRYLSDIFSPDVYTKTLTNARSKDVSLSHSHSEVGETRYTNVLPTNIRDSRTGGTSKRCSTEVRCADRKLGLSKSLDNCFNDLQSSHSNRGVYVNNNIGYLPEHDYINVHTNLSYARYPPRLESPTTSRNVTRSISIGCDDVHRLRNHNNGRRTSTNIDKTQSNITPTHKTHSKNHAGHIKHFPPLDVYGVGPSSQLDLTTLVTNLAQLSNCAWYGDNISREGACRLLDSTTCGTFVLRNSVSPTTLFALSVKTRRGTTSVRIRYTNQLFSLDSDHKMSERSRYFTSIPLLVEYYTQMSSANKLSHNVWLESSGRKSLPVKILYPMTLRVSSLKHQCRLVVNQNTTTTQNVHLSHDVADYLRQYPYKL